MEEAGERRAQTEASRESTARPRSEAPRPKAAIFALAVAFVLGAIGLFSLQLFRSAPEPQQAATPRVDHGDNNREAGQAASGSARVTPEPATPRPPWVALDPSPPKTVAELIEEAGLTAERLVESFSDDPDAIELKARVEYYLRDYSAAMESWQRCVEVEPNYAYAYHGLGLVAAKKADYESAAAEQRRALALAPGFSEAAVELADALMKLDKLDEAIEVLEQHVEVSSRSASAHVTLGHAYLQARDYQKARDAYRAALAIHSEIPRAQFGLATALARLGQRDESRQAMERFKELEAKKVEVHTDLRSRFDDLGAMCVDFAVHFTHASRIYLARGQVAEAERLCRRAATLDPNNVQCRIQLASLFQQTDRGEEALRMCRQLSEIEPENAGFRLNLGIMYGNLGRLEDAEEAFEEVTRLAPQSAEGRAALIRLYLRTGHKLAEAARLAQEVVRIEPDASSYFLLSQARAANGDRVEAISAIEKAIAMDPANPQYPEMLKLLGEEE